jgi:low affinity Fe/Cu permease
MIGCPVHSLRGPFRDKPVYSEAVTMWKGACVAPARRLFGWAQRNGGRAVLTRNMTEQKQKSWLEQIGCDVSSWVSDLSAHPFAQIVVILLCVAWFLIGWNVNLLTATLSILAITLSQMVLNRQKEREIDAHRRDVAMHAKLDELIAVSRRARNDLVGVEERDEEEIVQLKEEVKEAIGDSPEGTERADRDSPKSAVDRTAEQLKGQPSTKANGRSGQGRRAAGAKR